MRESPCSLRRFHGCRTPQLSDFDQHACHSDKIASYDTLPGLSIDDACSTGFDDQQQPPPSPLQEEAQWQAASLHEAAGDYEDGARTVDKQPGGHAGNAETDDEGLDDYASLQPPQSWRQSGAPSFGSASVCAPVTWTINNIHTDVLTCVRARRHSLYDKCVPWVVGFDFWMS